MTILPTLCTLFKVDLTFDRRTFGRADDSNGLFSTISECDAISGFHSVRCKILSELFFTFQREVNFHFAMKTFVFIIFTSLFFSPERSLFFTDSSLYRFHESTWKSSQSPAIISRKQLSDSCNGFRSHECRVAQLVTEVCGWSTSNSECCWSVRCGGREIIHLLILWSTSVTTGRWSVVCGCTFSLISGWNYILWWK